MDICPFLQNKKGGPYRSPFHTETINENEKKCFMYYDGEKTKEV